MIETSRWTVRCAGCGFTRPWSERERGHDCPNPATLDTALEMFATADERLGTT